MYSGIVLKYNDKCLLCKRSEKYSHPNKWFIPAGKIEIGETPREAVVRELFEETNIEINETDIDFIGTIPAMDDEETTNGDFIYIFVIDLIRKLSPNLSLAIDGKEHTECGYFNLEEMNSLGLDMNLLKIIKKYFDRG
jgi:ADP-ribose pyrophosphatase YjhB (NUDIX family)